MLQSKEARHDSKALSEIAEDCEEAGLWKEVDEHMGYNEQPIDTVALPAALAEILEDEPEAKAFYEGLSEGYKRGYCDWVGGAKQPTTRQNRAEKALAMLKNKQKTLKTV